MLLSTSDYVRADAAIEEDGLEAEVAAGREGQECYSQLVTAAARHVPKEESFSAVSIIRKEIVNAICFPCYWDPIHVFIVRIVAFTLIMVAGSCGDVSLV